MHLGKASTSFQPPCLNFHGWVQAEEQPQGAPSEMLNTYGIISCLSEQ